MPKIRVHQLAKELDMSNEKVIEHLTKKGVPVKSSFEALDEETAEHVRKIVRREAEKAEARSQAKNAKPGEKATEAPPVEEEKKDKVEAPPEVVVVEGVVESAEEDRPVVEIPEGATIKEVGEALGKNPNDLIKTLIKLGEMVTINQNVSAEAIGVLGEDLGIKFNINEEEAEEEEEVFDDEASLQPRPPVITVMGHVDHGKTLLLDAIRKTDVIAGEAGGITQHIGAYQVFHNEKRITFIDTPGHEAFTAMRARGASVTDIAVLVVAADDGVMPQTIEAIDHAKAANVPIVVAINKIDKPDANPDKVRQALTEYELVPEAWGGDTVYVEVSAKQKTNIEELLDMLLLVAEIRELKANPDAPASGVTIEANLDKGRGPVATVLIQRGTIRVGQPVVIGTVFGKTRALIDDHGRKIKEAKPGYPVEIIGLSAVPSAGDKFKVAEDEKKARRIAEERALKKRQLAHLKRHVSLDDLFEKFKEGAVQELKIVLKGDTQGSIEAIRESLDKIEQSEVKINVIHKGAGAISESDVMLAEASNAIVIGFNVRPEPKAKEMAEKEEVDLRTYRIIYKLVEDITAACIGMLKPEYKEVDKARVEVRKVFKAPKIGVIAGSYVVEGEITRNDLVRLVRDGTVVYEGKASSLRRFKDDVKSVKEGFECGVALADYTDIKEDDIIESYELIEIPRG